MAPIPSRQPESDTRGGWVIVAIGFTALFLIWGIVFTFTVFARPLEIEFGLSSAQSSTVFSSQMFVFFLTGGLVGMGASSLPIRPIIATTALAVATGTVVLQVGDAYVLVLVGFALIGGASGTVFVILISIVPQWFDVSKGRAMGTMLVGSGLGVQFLPFGWLWLIDLGGIRFAFLVVGVGLTLVLAAGAVVIRRPPVLRGDGTGRSSAEIGQPNSTSTHGKGGLSHSAGIDREWLRRLFASQRFWLAFVGFVLFWGWYFAFSADLVDILTADGVNRTLAAQAFGIIGGVSVVSRLGSGILGDRFGLRPTLTTATLLSAVGILLLLLSDGTILFMYLSLGTFGIALGAMATLYPPIIVRAFDPQNATAVVGIFQIGSAITGFLGPLFLYSLASVTGGYDVPLMALATLTVLGALLFHVGTAPKDV